MSWKIHSFLALILLLFSSFHQPYVLSSLQEYKRLIQKDPSKALIDLKKVCPSVFLDIRYATHNNFLGFPIYKIPKAYVRFPLALAIIEIQKELEPLGLSLKIYDAYRPYSVTKKMWELTNGSPYVANPAYGSVHNRGTALDLTLVNLLDDTTEVPMPSQYDEFNIKASHQYYQINRSFINNRNLLKRIMEKHGFIANEHEWWHYDFKNYKHYELLDISFEDLEKLDNQKP
jgi:D-alanyl-D-alanine dipeptidase